METETAAARTTRGRSERIDVMRGFSILVVLLLHYSSTYKLKDSVFADVLGPGLLRRLIINGNYGVTVFFVVSGFLITSNAIERYGGLPGVRPARFYGLRAARILPCLVVALTIVIGLGLAGVHSFVNEKHGAPMPLASYATTALSVLTFWHNVLMERWGYFNYAANIYWSLSVEEVFYLAFPIACVLGRRTKWVSLLLVVAMVVGPVYRSRHDDDELFYMYDYLGCFDAIAFGCATAILARRVTAEWLRSRWIAAAGAVLVVVTYLRGIGDHEIFGFTQIAIGASMLLVGARTDGNVAGARSRLESGVRAAFAPIRWLGRHSYELYLFHIVVLGVMRDVVPLGALPRELKPAWLLLFLAFSSALAWAIARFYAEPSNAWLRGRLPSGAGHR